jgi:hypothetical protein
MAGRERVGDAMSVQAEGCDTCPDGRMLGEAVHTREGDWRFFLSCTTCGGKKAVATETLLQPSATGPSRPANEGLGPLGDPLAASSSAASSKDRPTCVHPGCATVLSIYNKGARCGAHPDRS